MTPPRTLPAPELPKVATFATAREPMVEYHSAVEEAAQVIQLRERFYSNRDGWTYEGDVAAYLYNADAGVFTLVWSARDGDPVDRDGLSKALTGR